MGRQGVHIPPFLPVTTHDRVVSTSAPPQHRFPPSHAGWMGGTSGFQKTGYLAGVWGGHLDLISRLDLVDHGEAKQLRR